MADKNLTGCVALLAAMLSMTIATGTQAATLNVPGDYPTIGAAFASAQVGDRIELAPGVYRENNLKLPAGITLAGTGNTARDVTIDGQGQGRMILAEGLDRVTIISDITLANGRATGHTDYDRSGGAIFCSNSQLQITRCIFRGNSSDGQGGAIRCSNSSPMITGCLFTGNSADNGGGGAIDCSVSSSPLIRGCEFRDNSAMWGGALSCRVLSSPLVAEALFAGNTALGTKGFGGAVFADFGSTPQMQQSTFTGNTARYGGALVCLSDSETNLTNCTVVGNTAQVAGGGLFSYYASPRITASIIGFQTGTGVSSEGTGVPQISCSDIYGNSHGDWVGGIAGQLSSNENLAIDPLFCPDTGSDPDRFPLQDGSPCGAGDLTCGTMGAWPVGCGESGAVITTFDAVWGDQDAELTWHSQPRSSGSSPEFRLVGFRLDTPDEAWEVPIRNLGGGYYEAQDDKTSTDPDAAYKYQLFIGDGDNTWSLVKEVTLSPVPAFPGIDDLRAAPNPFNPMTTISFRLGTAQRTRISVYSADGRRVAVLANRRLPAGPNSQVWDGRDSQGLAVGSGTYIVLVEGSVESKTRKITLLK